MAAATTTEEAPQEQPVGLIISAVAVTLLLASLGQTIVSTALPTIVGELGGIEHLTWVVTAYLLSSTIVAPIYGKLGDLYGRKIVLQAAIVIFLIGAVLSGIATSMTFLIIARGIQGLGGGGLIVVAMTIVADIIPPRQRGKVQGLFAAVFGVATVVGPLLGGFLVEHFSWHWIFFLNVPLALIALGVIAVALKTRANKAQHRIDYLGALLIAGSLSSLVLFTTMGGTTLPWLSAPIIGLVVLALVLGAAFIFVELRAAEPMLPMTLFANKTFTLASAILFISGLAMFGALTFLPLFMQTVTGISPTQSGLQMLPVMVGMLGTSMISGQVMSRTGRYRWMPIAGAVALIVGLVLMATLTAETSRILLAVYMFVFGVGLGFINSVLVTAVQNAIPRTQMGAGTAGTTLFRQIGGSLGVSVFGAIFANGLASQLGNAMPEGGASSAFNAAAIAAMP